MGLPAVKPRTASKTDSADGVAPDAQTRSPVRCAGGTPGPAQPRAPASHGGARKCVQNRIADKITTFAGSMAFVYLHVIWFSCWIAFGVEDYPYGLLTMIVSLEAIFLSTFVMISQNRADAKRQVIANEQWKTVQEEDQQNQELLELSQQILELTKEVRSRTQAR